MEASVTSSKVDQNKLLFLHTADHVEDEAQILIMLTAAGYEVICMNVAKLTAESQLDADELVAVLACDEISLNQLLACVSVIKRTANTLPVLLLCEPGRLASEELNELLEAGISDYVIKPIRVEELILRIEHRKAQLRLKEAEHPTIHVVDLEVITSRREVYRAGELLQLTVKEYDLLLFLMEHINEVCSRDDILRKVWHVDFRLGTNVVDVYIKHLREKIDKGRRTKLIQTVRGIGYMLKTGESSE